MNPDSLLQLMLRAGWAGMLLGILSGAVIGLCFHREDWMGGYASYRRRLTRLGHISFFGLALVNFCFAFTQSIRPLPGTWGTIAAEGFLLGAATMPTVCFLSAWRKPFRHLFFIPVGGVLLGVISELWNL